MSDLGAKYQEDETDWVDMLRAGHHDLSHVDDEDLREVDRQQMQQYGARSILYIPLRVKGEILGFVELWESRRRREFTADEIALCQAIAQNAAIALENAELYDQIKASLREKEVLLQEVHHRVKNNLQVISSLLNLQANAVEGTRALDVLRDSQDRVRSMALVHEKLYQSSDLSQIDFADYTRSLTRALLSSYKAQKRGISLHTNTGDVSLSIDAAIPCGLILSELVSNALKHAFPDGRRGSIVVGLWERNGMTVLTVRDDGIGMPAEIDMLRSESLGLQLVSTLVTQLDGALAVERERGTMFTVKFPATRREQQAS
jgi:two-component sensor histidine kinase